MSELRRLYTGTRCSGRIKQTPDDFVVEEITRSGAAIEKDTAYTPDMLGFEERQGKFSVFVMQKRDWNTSQALKAVSRAVGRGMKSMGFAGTKDRLAVSTQLCSAFGATPAQLEAVHIKDISINGAWGYDEKVAMGALLGNRFTLTVREASGQEHVPRALETLNGLFPNYFGEQRFGVRDNNVSIGIALLKGDFEKAAMTFLTDIGSERSEDAIAARKRLAEERDFKAALQYFPRYLKYERTVLEYLSRFPTNYANALRKLPRSLSLMFVHAVEGHIFNEELAARIASGDTAPRDGDTVCYTDSHGFPDIDSAGSFDSGKGNALLLGSIVGYDTEKLTELESELLDGMGIGTESFKMQGMKELNCKGATRVMFAPYKWLGTAERQDSVELKFELPAGAYATVLLDELVDSQK